MIKTPTPKQFKTYLKREGYNHADIAAALGVRRESVTRALSRPEIGPYDFFFQLVISLQLGPEELAEIASLEEDTEETTENDEPGAV